MTVDFVGVSLNNYLKSEDLICDKNNVHSFGSAEV